MSNHGEKRRRKTQRRLSRVFGHICLLPLGAILFLMSTGCGTCFKYWIDSSKQNLRNPPCECAKVNLFAQGIQIWSCQFVPQSNLWISLSLINVSVVILVSALQYWLSMCPSTLGASLVKHYAYDKYAKKQIQLALFDNRKHLIDENPVVDTCQIKFWFYASIVGFVFSPFLVIVAGLRIKWRLWCKNDIIQEQTEAEKRRKEFWDTFWEEIQRLIGRIIPIEGFPDPNQLQFPDENSVPE